jgi:hypothetical protein
VVGFLAGGVPVGGHSAGWLAGSAILAGTFVVSYLTLLRFDLTLVPLAVTGMSAVGALARGAQRAYPGSLVGSVAAAALLVLVGWWCFVALRRARAASNIALAARGQSA